jgi:hypothetical protein
MHERIHEKQLCIRAFKLGQSFKKISMFLEKLRTQLAITDFVPYFEPFLDCFEAEKHPFE